jgi:hypothetical protein
MVPTPALPKLSAVKDEAFGILHDVVERLSNRDGAASAGVAGAELMKSDDPVLKQEHVGGYLATCLSLANPTAAEDWLVKNKFPVSSETKAWLKPYVEKQWVITAFRLDANGESADLKAVDMAFTTDKPFYPYREPAQEPTDAARELRVMFLSDGPMKATMGADTWVGKEEANGRLNSDEIAALQPLLPGTNLNATPWLTSFVDSSSPRDGKDEVYFQKTWPRNLLGSLAVYLAVLLLGTVTIHRFRKTRRKPSSP